MPQEYYICEIYHHGIKGQKWGIRRFQKKDGSLTPAGKQRYDDGAKKKSNHRQKLESKYRSQGMSQAEAEAAATKRIRTEVTLAAIGTTTVAAATAYVVRKNLKNKADGLVKAGESLQRIEISGDGTLHDRFYAAANKADKTKYTGFLGITRKVQNGKAFMMDIDVEKDIKIAGRDKAVSAFKNALADDPKLGTDTLKLLNGVPQGGKLEGLKGDKFVKRAYEKFNVALVGDHADPTLKEVSKKFYDNLKAEGYGAIRDVNDMKFSGYKAKNPLIVFGQSGNVGVKTVRELSDSEIGKNLVKAGARMVGEELATDAAVVVSAGTLIGASQMYTEDRQSNKNVKTR